MKRFIIQVPPNSDGVVHLYDKDYHYLVRVRRLKSGMCFDALLPDGRETQIRILSTVDNILIGECLVMPGQVPPNKEAGTLPPIALFQGIPRGTRMDLIARQAAECGVWTIAPFFSEYSQVRLKESQREEKTNRWKRIIKEARQQSGSVRETKILAPCSFDALLEYWESLKKQYRRPIAIMLHQEPLEKGSFHDYLCNNPDFAVVAVGPEGGFSPKEAERFKEAGFKPLILGNNILRTETAALYGITAIKTILAERKSWKVLPKE